MINSPVAGVDGLKNPSTTGMGEACMASIEGSAIFRCNRSLGSVRPMRNCGQSKTELLCEPDSYFCQFRRRLRC